MDDEMPEQQREAIDEIWERWQLDDAESKWFRLLSRTMIEAARNLEDVPLQRVALCFSEFCELFSSDSFLDA